ncbi:MAG: prepilin peptidase [Candidatus Taylorbacteria bacterium]|nr:prepilin peptidase [Candidatus Taylorbacteria bacterium]
MLVIIGVFVAIFGLIIGSFLNVVILRYNSSKGIGGRSQCFSCAKKLEWYELLPLVSFVFLRGRCRSCRSDISYQYPMVETATAVLFVLLYYSIEPFTLPAMLYFVIHAIAAAILIVIFVYDLRHKIIPDSLSFTLMAVSFIGLFVGGESLLHLPQLIDFLSGIIFFAVFGGLWFVSKGRWIGFGDAKLVVSLGWLAGLVFGVSGIFMAFWLGAVFSVIYLVILKKKRTIRNVEVPFAPYLILGMYIAWFGHLDFLFLNALFFQ